MGQAFDVCIRGAGVVGRAMALLLARERLRVALVVQPPSPAMSGFAPTDVRAYALNSASRVLLESLRSWPEAQHCTPVSAMRVHGDAGAQLGFDAARMGVDALAWIVDLPALQARLVEATRYQPLIEIVDAPCTAALTVVCEGRASATRAEFGVAFHTMPYAQRAIATRLDWPAQPHGGVARQWFLRDGVLALLPMGGADGTATALVWSVEEARAAVLMGLDDDAFARAVETACGLAAGTGVLTGSRADWPLQLSRADRWAGSMPGAASSLGAITTTPQASWVLAGDAAHTVHPLAGQGLNLGLGDAAELAHLLKVRDYWRSPGDLRLLRRYERARKAALWPLGLATDGLQQLFSHPGNHWETVRTWGVRAFDGSGPVKAWMARQAMGTT